MKTKSGYITNGTYIKFQYGFTGWWIVELAEKSYFFKTEIEADNFIKNLL